MLSRLLSMVVLLGFIIPSQPPKIPTTNPNSEYKLYLPLSINTYPHVNVFTSGHTLGGGVMSRRICVYGYTTALTATPVYSVTLAVDMVPTLDNTYPHTEYISPTLDATLPDQKNPFWYCVYCCSFAHPVEMFPGWGVVKLTSERLDPPNGRVIYPLTVITWSRKVNEEGDDYIHGEVRNDSGHRLVDIRVVGLLREGLEFWDGFSSCEAVLETSTLNPGKKTDFYIEIDTAYSNYDCVVDVSEFSAQGVAEP